MREKGLKVMVDSKSLPSLKFLNLNFLLVVELDYLPDSKVFVFSCVYTPWRLYTLEECIPINARGL
jgi:hypothetical protein